MHTSKKSPSMAMEGLFGDGRTFLEDAPETEQGRHLRSRSISERSSYVPLPAVAPVLLTT
jgi:hypothetical protein